MNRKNILILLLALLTGISLIFIYINKNEVKIKKVETKQTKKVTPKIVTKNGITYINNILIVNKQYSLPKNYAPGENKEAGTHIKEMIRDMQKEGLDVSSKYSGYRSYSYQVNLYNRYVLNDGVKKADTYSARPGYSEHQTGLSFDLLHQNGQLIKDGKETIWIKEHAHEYGFIVRYPVGKEKITGYTNEAWHLRYVGTDIAYQIYKNNGTLEEYLHITSPSSYKTDRT